MSWIRDNVTENPMMAEVSRFKQLIRGKGLSSMGIRTVLFLAIIISGFIGWMIAYNDGNFPPAVILYAQFFFCALAIPLRFYGTIAGEREKRSWELLRVAPVTNMQLAMGKFASMAYMIFLIHAIFFLPFLFSILKYGRHLRYSYTTYSSYAPDYQGLSYFRVFSGEAYTILIALFIASLTLFFSARSKRSYTALALTLGTVLLLFVFMPVFTGILTRSFSVLMFLNPMSTISYLSADHHMYGDSSDQIAFMGVAASMGSLVFLIITFLFYAANTLAFADNLVKFIPKKKQEYAGS